MSEREGEEENERKGRPADVREKRDARKVFCPWHSRYSPCSRERATQHVTPTLFIHALNLTNVLGGRSYGFTQRSSTMWAMYNAEIMLSIVRNLVVYVDIIETEARN